MLNTSDKNTRYVQHIGGNNNITLDVTSTTGAVDGYVGGENKNISRDGQTGGAYFGFSDVGPHAGGPTGGLANFTAGKDGCGVVRDGGMDAGKQHTYLQSGGGGYGYVSEGNARHGFDTDAVQSNPGDFRGSYAPIKSIPIPSCMTGGGMSSDLRKIKHFRQVRPFWTAICPGAVGLYHTHLEKLEAKHPEKVLAIVKAYTKAFQHEVNALNKKSNKGIKKEMKGLKTSMRKAGVMIRRIAPKGMKMHHMIEQRHIRIVEKHLAKHKATMKAHKKHHNKTRKSHSKKHHTRKHKNTHRRKTMKGGYTQFGANVPNTPAHAVSTDGGYKMSTPGATMNKNCDNCVDNYNHYEGKGSDTGVFDQDVKA